MPRTFILLICLASGFSALVCELVWTRMLVPVFGNTMAATGMVAGVFMAGLALGGYAGGRGVGRLHDQRQALLAYGALEAGIGLFAVLFPFLNQALMPAHLHLVSLIGDNASLAAAARLLFFAVLLLPPTFLMGATFPTIGAVFIRDPGRTGRDTAIIYGVNTLGGTAGVLAAGFFLIRELGSRGSLLIAGGVSLSLAVAAGLAAAGGHGARPKPVARSFRQPPVPESQTPSALTGAPVRLVLTGAGLAGFCALAYEMVWTRLLVLVVQNSVYAFSLVLAGFLAGIAMGSLLAAPVLQRKWHPLPLFGMVQVLCGVACLLVPLAFFLPRRPGEISYLSFLLTRPLFVVLVPMVLSGALVPIAVAVVRRAGTGIGRTLGNVYAVNSLGSVGGALLAGFVLIPVLGCHRTGLLLFAAQVLCGSVILAAGCNRLRSRLLLPAAGLGLVVLCVAWLPADLVRQRYVQAAPSEQQVFFSEGRVATASVTRNRAGNLILYLNGIPEVTNDLPALRTFRLMALLPYLMQPDPGDALMITFGAGISAGMAVHLYPQVDCVELNDTCTQIARIFHKENRNVLGAGNLTLHIDDGRNFLLHAPKRYATIITDATHPHSYDSWILFTREFYRLCHRRLGDNGVFCQWLPLHGLAPQQLRTIVNTVRGVFPELSIWSVDGAYCLMVAGKTPLRLDPQRLAKVLNRRDLRPFLSPIGLDNPYAVLGSFVAARGGVDRLLKNEKRINTDNRPYNQFFPLATTGFGRLKWHVENLRQIQQCKESVSALVH